MVDCWVDVLKSPAMIRLFELDNEVKICERKLAHRCLGHICLQEYMLYD